MTKMSSPRSTPDQAARLGMRPGDDGVSAEASTHAPVLVVGLGEVGRPLLQVLSAAHSAFGRDVADRAFHGVQILHVCFPFGPEFTATASGYVARYRPGVVVVNSTVVPGTTRAIQEQTATPTVYSPVRGKHAQMAEELRRYRKFVAGTSAEAVATVEDHFAAAQVVTGRMSSPESLELAKLLETSYFGVLVAWAQEMDRFAAASGADHAEMVGFFDEIDFFPPVTFQPGYIGGHCVMPNLDLLERVRRSPFIEAVRQSNDERRREWQGRGRSVTERISPRPRGSEGRT
jgi:UDP-N-acetyl-D-mannosaminuronate dehydrogenase